MEIWKKVIQNYEYEVSDKGQVRNSRTGRVLKQEITNRGYRRVILRVNGKPKHFQVHRLVYEAFNGNITEGYQIDHIDGNPSNNNLENLKVATPYENTHNNITFSRYLKKIKILHQDPDFRKKHIEAMKKLHSNPEYERNRIEALKNTCMTDEWKCKYREAMIKRSKNPEWHKNVGDANRKKAQNPEWLKKKADANRKLAQDPEWLKKNADANRKKAQDPEWRKNHADAMRKSFGKSVFQIDKVTGETIRKWPCAADVERELGLSQSNISACCLGKRKTTGGYRWQYAS